MLPTYPQDGYLGLGDVEPGHPGCTCLVHYTAHYTTHSYTAHYTAHSVLTGPANGKETGRDSAARHT